MTDKADLDVVLAEKTKQLAATIAEEDFNEQGLMPRGAYEEKIFREIESSTKKLQQKMFDGLMCIIEVLDQMPETPMKKDALIDELDRTLGSAANPETRISQKK